MTTDTKRTRTRREPLPLSAVKVIDVVSPENVPLPKGGRTSSRRKWQELADNIVHHSQQDLWLVVTLDAGYDPDVVRSGLKEELKRSNLKLEWRVTTDPKDQSLVMYFFCRPVKE